MKVITMESSAYKEMMAQIANIAGYIREARDEKKRKRETEDKLLDTAQAAKMLNVSKRTMQRMRTDWKSHATLTLLATQDLPTFGYNMIDPLKSWCWGSILFYPFKISRFS